MEQSKHEGVQMAGHIGYTKQSSSKFPESVTQSLDAIMHDRRQRKQVSGSDGYSRGLPTCRNGRDGHMILGLNCRDNRLLDPEKYKDYIWYNLKGKPLLYVQLNKALYGTLQAALIFLKLLSNTLQEWGFSINKYDRCVANKIIKGKQCTI